VANRLDLDIADVYRALAYYHEHPEKMAEIQREREEFFKQAREESAISPQELE